MDTEVRRTHQEILTAAEELIRKQGLGAATTRAIAARAGCAEGSIYRHFPDKYALIIEIVRTRLPIFLDLIYSLPERAGKGTVRKNLEELASAALAFYRGIVPLAAGAVADHELLIQQRRHFKETDTGPRRIFRSVDTYLRREQRLGRISTGVSAEHVARLLLGACFVQAFVEELLGEEAFPNSNAQFVRKTVGTLIAGLAPTKGENPLSETTAGRGKKQRIKA